MGEMKMTTEEIIASINQAVIAVIENEKNTLVRGLNEPIISGHLAKYLAQLFKGYNVDPEYNGDLDKPNDRKALTIAAERLREIKFEPNENDIYEIKPDVIIHVQGTNKDNLLVVEVKKDSSSSKSKEFDLIKLEHLTIDHLGNHYNYRLGVFISFGTGENTGRYNIKYFQNGILTMESQLKD